MATNTNSRLLELSGSDFEIADGQPDIRGWDVKDGQGKYIGEVDELIFDKQSLKVRYIVLDLDDNELDLDDKEVLIPIGMAELHEKGDDVLLPSVTAAQLGALPEYDGDDISESTESSIRNVFSGGALAAGIAASSTGSNRDEFYEHEHFNENNLYQRRRAEATEATTIPVIEEQLQIGKKTVETGGVRLRSRIIETPVEEDIRLKEEHVKVERESVNRPATEADFQQGIIEATETAEVPVVSKEAHIVEEVTLNKEVREHEHTINETLRSTEVDVDKISGGDLKTKSES